MNNNFKHIDFFFGLLAILVVIYRLLFIMYPLMMKGIQNNEISEIFKSFTLLV